MFVVAAEIRQVTADILDSSNLTISSRDITQLAQGSGEHWSFSWDWNLTTLQLADDNSPVMDANGGPVPGLLYLNPATAPVHVAVTFDPTGRISSITGSNIAYYVSEIAYRSLNLPTDYETMLANETARRQFIKIELGKSMIQFLNVVDGRLFPSGSNHTLQGTLNSLEPHAIRTSVSPGRYELRVRVENAVDAIQMFGEYFNVTAPVTTRLNVTSASDPMPKTAANGSIAGPSEKPAKKSDAPGFILVLVAIFLMAQLMRKS